MKINICLFIFLILISPHFQVNLAAAAARRDNRSKLQRNQKLIAECMNQEVAFCPFTLYYRRSPHDEHLLELIVTRAGEASDTVVRFIESMREKTTFFLEVTLKEIGRYLKLALVLYKKGKIEAARNAIERRSHEVYRAALRTALRAKTYPQVDENHISAIRSAYLAVEIMGIVGLFSFYDASQMIANVVLKNKNNNDLLYTACSHLITIALCARNDTVRRKAYTCLVREISVIDMRVYYDIVDNLVFKQSKNNGSHFVDKKIRDGLYNKKKMYELNLLKISYEEKAEQYLDFILTAFNEYCRSMSPTHT